MARRLLHRPHSILSSSSAPCPSTPILSTLTCPPWSPTSSTRVSIPPGTASHTPTPIQKRTATLLRRPKRPYQFTQLVTLSDGSTFLQRTTSPAPIHKSVKDVRNSPLWNPSNRRLNTVEEDEAGRLKKFRERFGRGWDAGRGDDGISDGSRMQKETEGAGTGSDMRGKVGKQTGKAGNAGDAGNAGNGAGADRNKGSKTQRSADETGSRHEDSLFDLISGFSARQEGRGRGSAQGQMQSTDTSMKAGQPGKKR